MKQFSLAEKLNRKLRRGGREEISFPDSQHLIGAMMPKIQSLQLSLEDE
jgi:hypothetical protein